MIYNRKSGVVKAIRWDGESLNNVRWLLRGFMVKKNGGQLIATSSYGSGFTALKGDWIVFDSMGCFYSVSDESFKQNYEERNDT